MMKQILIFLKRLLIGIGIFTILYFAIGHICSQIIMPAEENVVGEIPIYIKTNGKHIDIAVPVCNAVKDWRQDIPFANNVSQDTTYNYLAFGWGDKGFFMDMPTWDDLTFSLAFKAAFWLGSTAMHTTHYYDLKEDKDCRRIMLSQDQYERLVSFITKKFKTDAAGRFINIKTDATYGTGDAFYEAHGRYNLFYSCNTWINNALATCGQKHCLWTFFDDPIFDAYNVED